MALAEVVYRFTQSFPKEEAYGLTSQMRRSGVSIASNIAEGYGRENRGSFVQFLRVAQGSLKELETQAMIAKRVGIMPAEDEKALLDRCEETGKMLRALIRTVQSKQAGE
ncbi:MAG: four helix bundle protein [Oricola sp.]|nr:four helix bundle protein [Oricola sp.]